MSSAYDYLVGEAPGSAFVIITRWGTGTEHEAVSRIQVDVETGHWDGYLIFKDEHFSPHVDGLPGLQFKYQTPGAGNGVLANTRAGNTWETLISIFDGLRAAEISHD